ncbi:hypothetical protein LSH36_647g01032 [Paralvinella palmiformis]|uniref:ADP-ribosylation factor-related protein 1 n=1 Tax=Paralvinella palmiformis TaxID=53620 RepID=A0AAD9J4D5_9ANNE|nr:hypothetical protein LSH36_647g01032 [Paralvinella palmiformis]
MFTLLAGLWKYLFQKDEYFILILGLDNAGKTTYLEQTKTKFNKTYKGMNPNKITATVGLNLGKIDFGSVRLNFWDLGGQEELQSLWDKVKKMISSEALNGVPLLLLANKQDLQDCMPVSKVKEEFKDHAHKIGHRDCHIMGVSALQGDGVDEGIQWMVQCVKRNAFLRPPTQKDIT